MKEKFRDVKFSRANTELFTKTDEVIVEFQKLGYVLTLRQLYYQLVSREIILNLVPVYHKLSGFLTDARMAGMVDWEVIEDRTRVPKKSSEWSSLKSLIDSAVYSFRLKRWKDQNYYVELWTEKDALTSVLLPQTEKYHVPLVVNKGYSSASAMYRASKRLIAAAAGDKKPIILYLGDHDPSGLDMDRDIADRLAEFGILPKVVRIGLTDAQIKKYNPPPNPAKVTDPRATKYIEIYGRSSWEVDALRPDVLSKIVESSIKKYMDMKKYEAVIEEEKRLKAKLVDFGSRYGSDEEE